MTWRGWQSTPARKPVFVATYVMAGGLALWHTYQGTDIPPGILSLLNNMILVVSGMYGLTSSSEAIYGQQSGYGYGMLSPYQASYTYPKEDTH